jgi:hypothetical protein
MYQCRTPFIVVLAIHICTQVHAGVVSTTGAVLNLSFTPTFLVLGDLESNTAIFGFPEQQGIQLIGGLAVDISIPSTVPSATAINLSPGVISSGTRVNSYMLHFDPIGTPVTALALSGSVTFSTPILGIEVLTASLNSTDGVLGIPSTFYPITEINRGLELAVGQAGFNTFDAVTLTSDRKTVSVLLSTQVSLDEMRIITAVPEPSSLFLFGIAAVTLLAYNCRRSRA